MCTSCVRGVYTYVCCRYQRGRFYRGWGFCIGMFMVVTLIIVLSISLSVRYHDYDAANNAYAPGDTRIISYSSVFCDRLTVSGDEAANFYLLRNTPPLSGPTHNLSVNFMANNPPDNYQYLYYYLYPGTKIRMTYCVASSSVTNKFTFSLIKGNSNFNEWEADGSPSHTVKQFVVNNLCSSGPPANLQYTIKSEDTYYFVFDNVAYSTSVDLSASLVLNRTEYLPDKGDVQEMCSIYTSGVPCGVSVPLGSKYVALLQVSDQAAESEDDTNINYTWSCSPRVWVYILIVVGPLGFVFITTLVILIVCIVYVRSKSKKYTTIPTVAGVNEEGADSAETETPATSFLPPKDRQTTPTAPPPTNPGYFPPPTVYGGTDAPPPYPTDT